jgi:hypothetical protein
VLSQFREPGFRERNAREKPATGKWCCRCRQWLSVRAFRPDPRLNGGLDSWCRACHAAAVREWRERNPEYIAASNAKRRQEYREAHPVRERPCIVCGRPMTKRPNALVCGEECQRKRKREQRRALRRAYSGLPSRRAGLDKDEEPGLLAL